MNNNIDASSLRKKVSDATNFIPFRFKNVEVFRSFNIDRTQDFLEYKFLIPTAYDNNGKEIYEESKVIACSIGDGFNIQECTDFLIKNADYFENPSRLMLVS